MGAVRQVARDALVPLGIAAVATVEAVSYQPPELAWVLTAQWLACGILVGRRRWPMATAVAAFLATLSVAFLGPAVDDLASPVIIDTLACFALARYLTDLRGLVPVALFAGAVLVSPHKDGGPPDITDVVFVGTLALTPYALGRLMRTLAERNARLAEQAATLLRLQESMRAEAVSAERARIARELHDVIAHSVSAMVVQAAAAEDLVRTDPDRATRVLHEVATTGRRALADTGRLLHLIRDTGGEMGLAPEPGLDRLDELVDQFRRNGLDVDLSVEGALSPLPAGVDLSAYRIVQEALTNAFKYAGDRKARLRVRRSPTALLIDAENEGSGEGERGSGLGLVGMAERVSVFGGTLTHGLRGDGRFVLSATLPVGAADP